MKKIIIILIILLIIPSTSFATDQIIESQMEVLNLGSFITEGEKYTKEIFPEINVKNLITQSLTGKIDNNIFYKAVLKLFGKEIVLGVTSLGSILVIIVIHSILKSISESLGNENTSQIAYFVEYILIITIIMHNFVSIISNIRETINELFSTNINFTSNCNRTSCLRKYSTTYINNSSNLYRKCNKYYDFTNCNS